MLRPILAEDHAIGQRDERWADWDFGEFGPGGTIEHLGCFLVGLTIFFRRIGYDLTPPLLDVIFRLAQVVYSDDNMAGFRRLPDLFPSFYDDAIVDQGGYSASELRDLLNRGYDVILAKYNMGHFIVLESVQGNNINVIDTLDGSRRVLDPAWIGGVRALRRKGHTPQPPTPTPTKLHVGLHDEAGGEWMKANGVKGCCLVHAVVQRTPVALNFERLAENGISVIVRLNWGYADGTGTIPPPGFTDEWVEAMIDTINAMRGAMGVIIGNELNNPAEWPGGYPNPSHVVHPLYYVQLYNRIAEATALPIAPFSVDPYNVVAGEFGMPSDPKEWVQVIYGDAERVDFVAFHAKTQTNDPSECWSSECFTHPPLVGRYLHLKTLEDQLAWLPSHLSHVPVHVTELNPQRRDAVNLGWNADNDEWVRQSLAYCRSLNRLSGAYFYRYERAGDQAGFGMEDKPALLAAVAEGAA